MKKLSLFILTCFVCCNAFASTVRNGRNVVNNNAWEQNNNQNTYRAGVGIKNVSQQPVYAQQQYVPQSMIGTNVPVQNVVAVASQSVEQPFLEQKIGQQLQIERQRDICMRNNIGIGNTFVWAARNSNVDNYALMVEDINVPENNTCFVKVAIASTDSKVKVSDLPSRYFEMGRAVTCGSWLDEDMIEKRILDAKKSARTWGTVGGAVVGAGVGVGAMELFGNKLIGGAVQGQKALDGQELIVSQLKVLKKDNPNEYERVLRAIRDLEEYCNKPGVWDGAEKPRDCDAADNNFMNLLRYLD